MLFYRTLPLKKVKHLGGKFGDSVREILRINTMAELQQFTEKQLQMKFDEKNGLVQAIYYSTEDIIWIFFLSYNSRANKLDVLLFILTDLGCTTWHVVST